MAKAVSATNRLLVHEGLADDLYAAIDAAISELHLGDTMEKGNQYGTVGQRYPARTGAGLYGSRQ